MNCLRQLSFVYLFVTAAAFLFISRTRGDDLNPVALKTPPSHAPVPIAAKGEARASICVMDVPNSKEFRAALKELQTALQETAGVELPVVRGEVVEGSAIVLGACDAARRAGLVGDRLPVEGFVIKTAAERVFIVGHDDAASNSPGTAWGVYEFLERCVGVRWYWPFEQGGRSVIAKENLSVAPVWLEDAPVFRKRHIWPPVGSTWSGGGTRLEPLQLALRSGNSWPVQMIVHAPRWHKFEDLVERRPEVFQKRADGTRNIQMICYGDPLTLKTYLEHCEAVFDRDEKLPGDRSGIRGDSITVSPADMDVCCYCERCQALWDEDGGRYGTASKILADFVQRLAAEVKRRWPDKTILYLPYLNYTQAPEGYRFPGNVEIQLCGMPGIAQYKEPAIFAAEQENLEKWYRISGRKVQNWHYSCWPADRCKAPYQYPHVIQDYYRKNRSLLIGSFINGMGDHWPRHHISLYVWMKVLWNPDFDVDAAIREYCRRMYGPAANIMHQLVALECDGWEKSRWPEAVLTPQAVYQHSYPPAAVSRMKQLLRQARDRARGDRTVLARLDYFEAPFAEFYKEFEFVVHGEGTRPLVAQKVGKNPIVDGRLNDQAWQRAEPVTLVKHDQQKGEAECQFPTQVKMVWTLEGVTIGFHMSEPNPDGLVKNIRARDDGLMYWQDCAELFLDASGKNSGQWYQLIVNAAGTEYDTRDNDVSWDHQGLKTAVFVGKDYWSMEAYIPMSAYPDAAKPATGTVWHGQFCRHRMKDDKKSIPGRENQKLNAQFGGFNSNIADFAPIKFVE